MTDGVQSVEAVILNLNQVVGFLWAIATAMDGTEVDGDGNPITADQIFALTPLAMNVAMGAAYPSGDPDFPITYKCDLVQKIVIDLFDYTVFRFHGDLRRLALIIKMESGLTA